MTSRKAPVAGPEIKFSLVEDFFKAGYQNKLQVDECPPGAAVADSKNFILDDDGKWTTRSGSAYYGRKSTYSTPSTGGTVLHRRDGVNIPIVMSGTYSLYLHPDYNNWTALETNLSDGSTWGFAASDVNTGRMNLLAMSSQNDPYRIWNGATALVDTWTSDSITIQNIGNVWIEGRGFDFSTGSLSINGVVFAYTGENQFTFTGITPDPTTTAIAHDQGITQLPTQYPLAPQGGVLTSASGIVGGTSGGRVLVMQTKNVATYMADGGQIFGSRIDDPTYWTVPATSIPGDPVILNLPQGGGTITGACAFEAGYLLWKKDYISKLNFSQDNNDYAILSPFVNYDEHAGGDEGCVAPTSIFRLGTNIYFVSPTAVINTIQRVSSVDYPSVLPVSDPIKKYVESLTMDSKINGCGWRGRAYFFFPTDGKILVYDSRYNVWYPPFEGLSIVASYVKDGQLYGVLKDSPNIVTLWTGTTDLFNATGDVGFPINCELDLDKSNSGTKDKRKEFDRFYVEGIMNQTGLVTCTLQYDENGISRSFTLTGTTAGVFFSTPDTGTFGSEELGTEPLGGDGADSNNGLVKFRLKLTTKLLPFYNLQFKIKTSNYFKLLAFGPNVRLTPFRDKRDIFKPLS